MEIPNTGENSLGKYRPIHLLDRGNRTDTYLSEEHATGHKVALKVVRTNLAPDDLAAFLQTLQRYGQVLHPHLVRIREYGSSANRPFWMTTYMSKGSLRQRHLQGTQLAPDVVLTYARQIADALHHLHGQHLLHLNLRPENILLRDDGTLLLDDACLSTWPRTITQGSNEQAAWALYLAPEQIQGRASEASDQYALACLLYEWLSGKPPFVGTFADVVAHHLSAEPAPSLRTHLPVLSPDLEQVLAYALAKDPAKRFVNIRAFVNAFEQACHGPATPAKFGSEMPMLSPSFTPRGQKSDLAALSQEQKPNESQLPTSPVSGLTPQSTGNQTSVPQIGNGHHAVRVPRNCPGCGHPPRSQVDTLCPTCGYPFEFEAEMHLLTTMQHDLQLLSSVGGAYLPIAQLAQFSDTSLSGIRRVAKHGGASLTVIGLISHYHRRLQMLHQEAQRSLATGPQPSQAHAVQPTSSSVLPNTLEHMATSTPSKVIQKSFPLEQMAVKAAPLVALPLEQGPQPQITFSSAPPPQQLRSTPRRSPISTLRPLIDSPVGLMVALGTFLLLLAILGLPIILHNSPLPFLLTLVAQGFFAIMTVTIRRLTHFRTFSGIYTTFFASTVPLLALEAFQSSLMTNLPWLIGLAALYATITYGAFAVLQRFTIFGVLCIVALLVSDISLTLAVTGSYLWVAPTLLILTAPGVAALPLPGNITRSRFAQLLTTIWDVLRRPVMIFFWLIGGSIAGIYVPLTSFLILNSFVGYAFTLGQSVTLTLLITLLLLFAWCCHATRYVQWRNWPYVISLLLLLCVLFVCYTLTLFNPSMTHFIYGVGFLILALTYIGIRRWTPPRFYLHRCSDLSGIAIVLLAVLPLIVAPRVLQQMALSATAQLAPSFPLLISAPLLGIGCWLTTLVAIRPQGARTATTHGWPWLLLLSGLLFTWGFAALGLGLTWLDVSPFWWFWGLTLLCTLVAVLVRLSIGKHWAIVLDVLAVFEMLLTFWLGMRSQGGAPVALALFGLCSLFYCVLLLQHRSLWFFVSWLFALAELPTLFANVSSSVLLLSLFLPFAAVVIRRRMSGVHTPSSFNLWDTEQIDAPWQWDWPLVTFALICSAFIFVHDFNEHAGVLLPWINIALPVFAEFATFALVWYLTAALSSTEWWLIPAGIFALAMLIVVSQSFWLLVLIITGCTLGGIVIHRLARGVWSLPCYASALVGALLALPLSFLPSQSSLGAWVLLGFVALAALTSAVESQPEVLWLVPFFALASSLNSLTSYLIARQVTDFLHIPAIVLLSAVAGVVIGRVMRSEETPTPQKPHRWRWLAPCYTTALLAALLTGLSFLIHTPPVSQLIPGLLLGYALFAFLVVVLENAPLGTLLVIGFGVWGIGLSTQTYPDLLMVIGVSLLVLALLVDRLLKDAHPWSIHSGIIRISWSLVWTLLAEITWVSAALFPPTFSRAVLPDYPIFALLLFVILFYLTGFIQRQRLLCLLTPLFALWPLWELTKQGAFLLLFFIFCSCLLMIVIADLLMQTLRVTQDARSERMLWYVLPIFLTAGLAACLSGIAGSAFAPISQRGEAGGLLLLYSLGSWLILLRMRQPYLTLLTAVLGLWGVLLIMQTPVYTILGVQVSTDLVVTGLGVVAACIGLCTFQREKPASLVQPVQTSAYSKQPNERMPR